MLSHNVKRPRHCCRPCAGGTGAPAENGDSESGVVIERYPSTDVRTFMHKDVGHASGHRHTEPGDRPGRVVVQCNLELLREREFVAWHCRFLIGCALGHYTPARELVNKISKPKVG